MKRSQQEPPITQVLLNYLDKIYPVRTPSLEMSEREIFRDIGNRMVVDKLRSLFDNQNGPGRIL